MSRTRRIAAGLLAAASLAAAGPALAQGDPDNRFSYSDAVVVGNTSGTPIGGAPAGYDVAVRDVNNAPIPGSPVVLDFSATTIRLSSVQASGTTVDCVARTLSRLTDASGNVRFAARLGGFANTNAVQVIIQDGGPPYTVKARSTDVDGLEGRTGLNDFVLFSSNFLTNQSAQETDFDMNGATGLGDYVMFSSEFLGSAVGTYCP